MADHEDEPDGTGKQPPTLLIIPQELRDQILLEALQNRDNVMFRVKYADDIDYDEEYHWPDYRSREVKRRYHSLTLSCKQLYQETIETFFRNNTFEVWADGGSVPLSDRCCRLIQRLDINISFFVGNGIGYPMSCIRVRDTSVTMTTKDMVWHIEKGGKEDVTDTSEHDEYSQIMLDRLKPSLRMLRETLRAGHGIGIEVLEEVRSMMAEAVSTPLDPDKPWEADSDSD